MVRFFRIDHGFDNFEEYIDLEQVAFVRCSARYNEDNKNYAGYERLCRILDYANADFDYCAHIILLGSGKEVTIDFSALGWDEFLRELTTMKPSTTVACSILEQDR